jgi:hypothetical protein
MISTLILAAVLLLAVGLKYLKIGRTRCPECGAARQESEPLCSACGWIFTSPDDDD